MFKEANEFKKILNSEKSSEIDITFEIENSDFILEEINLKSIFADQIKVKIDDYLDKNFKLNYENNKLVSETKLII
ncbi:Uncharacterised protein [Metamycoplasma alkalescens]|uniref:Uncharacterized protein n=1 Tax=Metamycoplasma alkalescens TaxID=45363 RepID=A0A3B0P1F8_9BACT|nr:Uncharacterised protein [Metamycoplasma alkalescens]